MLEARIEAAKQAMPNPSEERPFRASNSRPCCELAAEWKQPYEKYEPNEACPYLQLTCMHDLGITSSLNLSLPDKESLIDTPQWQALLKAEIQSKRQENIYEIRKGPASSVVTCNLRKYRKSWC